MSKILEARVDRLEAIIMGLMDEIVALKELRHEIQTNHVNEQLSLKRMELQKQQLNAHMQAAAQAAQQASASSLYGLGSFGATSNAASLQASDITQNALLQRIKGLLP